MSAKMERVDSKAMQILAMYSDSDDDEENEGIRHRRRSSIESEKKAERRADPPDMIPEAPASSVGSQNDSEEKSEKSSPWSDAGNSPGSRSPKEPPPPARPDFSISPSPSATPVESLNLPRIDSQSLMLVSYDDDEQDESFKDVQRRKSDEAASESLKEAKHQIEISTPNSERSADSDMDAYNLLEKMENPDSPKIDADLELPPESTKKCAPELEAKFKKYFQQKASGYNFNSFIQNRKDFRNPSMYEKLVEHFGIDELGTNFSKDIFDPRMFGPEDFYEEISKRQRDLMDKIDKDKPVNKDVGADGKKRKTRFDNPGAQVQHSLGVGGRIASLMNPDTAGSGSGGKKTKN